MKHRIIQLTKKEFPQKLKVINNPPEILYAIGNINLLKEKSFGIIGTRKISEYGEKNCKFFTKELTLRDIPIVSGMALGTDTIAHKTALENNGKTIAVLGSGFDNIFPKENLSLFEDIIKNDGLVITEYENSVKPIKTNFPERNRIITAISEGILVIEAAYRSGTSITVRNAKNQKKKVFALPGRLDSCVGVGVNKMIKNGAILTTCIEDIISVYPEFKIRERKNSTNIKIKKEYEEIFYILKKDKENFESILMKTNLNLKTLIKILTDMQIDGIIKQDEFGIFEIAKEWKV